MNKDKLRKYIHSVLPVSEEKALNITDDFEYFSFPKNEFLLKENKLNRQTYCLETGYVRSFVLDKEGQEVIMNIYSAPCFVN